MKPDAPFLERQALSLGTAYAVDYGIHFLMPVVLVRALDADAFGQYRLLWLMAATVLALASLAMPQSLYYFLPRSDAAAKRLYIKQTALFLAGMGLLAGTVVGALGVWRPDAIGGLATHGLLVPVFLALWVVASLLDMLPTAEEQVAWQAKTIVWLALARAGALIAAAVLTRDILVVFTVLLGFAALKVLLLARYVARRHGLHGQWLQRGAFADQVRHAVPFGISGALYGLRLQADQWVAAAMFTVSQFAAFSIGAVLAPTVLLLRRSVNHVFLPSMSRLHADFNFDAMLALNNRANITVAALAYPLLAFCFAFTDPLVNLVFTPAYADAAPVMRIYIIGLLPLAVELQSVMLLFRQGGFAVWTNALILILSVGASLGGALAWGLPGAAAGSVVALMLDRCVSLARIARLTGTDLGRLQRWDVLLAVLAAAASAGAAAWFAVRGLPIADLPVAQLLVGMLVTGLAYPLALVLFGQGPLLASLGDILRHARPQRSEDLE